MATTDLNIHRERLVTLRARLRGEITRLADSALNRDLVETSRMPTHMAELGTDNFEQELTLNLLGNEKNVLEQIEAALERIEDGSYGKCQGCGRRILEARLDAVPYVALCIRCASQQEQQRPR
jgi:DnaK suppressor protein